MNWFLTSFKDKVLLFFLSYIINFFFQCAVLSFDKCIALYNHNHTQDTEFSCTVSCIHTLFLPLTLATTNLFFTSVTCLFRMSDKLMVASFMQHSAFEIHPYCCTYPSSRECQSYLFQHTVYLVRVRLQVLSFILLAVTPM